MKTFSFKPVYSCVKKTYPGWLDGEEPLPYYNGYNNKSYDDCLVIFKLSQGFVCSHTTLTKKALILIPTNMIIHPLHAIGKPSLKSMRKITKTKLSIIQQVRHYRVSVCVRGLIACPLAALGADPPASLQDLPPL